MTGQVAALLADGAAARAERLRFLTFALLGDHLPSSTAASGYRALRSALGGCPAAELLDGGTPFFWKTVQRCHTEVALGGADVERLADYVLRAAFDAFFDRFPLGFSLAFTAGPADLVWPALGLRFAIAGRDAVARKVGDRALELTTADGVARVDLTAPDRALVLPAVAIPGAARAKLVCARDPSLFEDEYIGRLVVDPAQLHELPRLIGKALEMIDAVTPSLGDQLNKLVRWYLPIDTPGIRTHNSFSVRQLTGVIFLSVAYDDIRIAEAIVHELHHNLLYLLQESEALYTGDDEQLYYSPFRPDPRPLDGLFHALFVFSGVADFLRGAEQLPGIAAHHAPLRGRRCEVVRQLRLGLAQVPRDRLSECGLRIFGEIVDTVTAHEDDFGVLRGKLPAPLAEHLTRWKTAHGALVHRILMPPEVELA